MNYLKIIYFFYNCAQFKKTLKKGGNQTEFEDNSFGFSPLFLLSVCIVSRNGSFFLEFEPIRPPVGGKQSGSDLDLSS